MLLHEAKFEYPGVQVRMASPGASLCSVGFEFIGRHPQRYAGLASLAVGAVGEKAAASEAVTDQFRVGGGIDQVTGCRNLRPGLFALQVAARIGCSCIKLQHLKGKILEVRHGRFGFSESNSRQYRGSKCQAGVVWDWATAISRINRS